jgi:ATP-dependent DNA helicase RecQ
MKEQEPKPAASALESTASRTLRRARELRLVSSMPERVLWKALRGRRLAGLKFRRQHPIPPYIVDFFCEELRLVVEVDGMTHLDRGEQDARREMYLRAQGYRLLRVTNRDVIRDLQGVLEAIRRHASR